jgi:chemosensory pili system protein ChpA (sensor histidine kinase/response regulator)
MDAELLQGFIAEAESYLPEIFENVAAFLEDHAEIERLKAVQGRIATIKGAAAMMGLNDVGAIGGELEQEIKTILGKKKGPTEKQTANLAEKVSQFEAVLKAASESIGEFSGEPGDVDFSAFAEESHAEEEKTVPAETDENFEDFEIDAEMLEVFAMEAEDHLQNIGTNLSVLEKNPNNREALLEIRRSSHTLKGSAGIVGLKKLSSLAHRMEDLLDFLSDNEIEGNVKVFELLLASTDCLEALTKGQDSPVLNQIIAELYPRFDELLASLNNPQAETISAVSDSEPIVGNDATSQAEIAPLAPTLDLEESAEAAENPIKPANPRAVIRVSLERLDHLVKVVSEMVITRSIFEQRILELEQQIQELNHTTNRLRRSTNKLEVDYEASALGNKSHGFSQYSFSAKTAGKSFMNRDFDEFDTLEFDQYTEFHQTTRELIEATSDTSAIHNDLDNVVGNLDLLFDSQRSLIEDMQENLLRLRMVPLNSLAARLHRTIRVTANEEGKKAELFIENENVEIDTQILDSFVDPLIHILRNAVAHGIESPETRQMLGKSPKGKISFKAYSEGTHVVFVVSDDGRGISVQDIKDKAVYLGFVSPEEAEKLTDEEAFSLVFLPGLSTAGEINEISGRGVGMNVVKSTISRQQGDIFITSEPQKGTTFTVRLPMSLAVTRVIIVKADDQTFALPLKLIKQVVEVSAEELEVISRERVFKRDGKSYKFYHFNEILQLPVTPNWMNSRVSLLLLETPGKPCALMIDHLVKPEEVVIKPLGNLLKGLPDIIGATILGDGSVVPILDLVNLLKNKSPKHKKTKDEAKAKASISVMIVDDSPSVRHVNSTLIKNAGWKPVLARDGVEALEIIQTFRDLPDVILTDVEMPKMDGYEFLAALKRNENLSSIPVIMITSRSGDKHRRKAYDLGVSDYLTKPYEETVLIRKIKRLVEK